jgi:hypothetical protein
MNSQLMDILKLQVAFQSHSSWKPIVFLWLYEVSSNLMPKSLPTCRRQKIIIETKRDLSAEIIFEKQKEDKNAKPVSFQYRIDSVIHSISKLPSISRLISITHHDYLPHEFDPIKIDSDIYFQLLDIRHSEGNIEFLKFRIFCYDHDSIFLQNFVDTCAIGYDRHMKNKLGNNKYFFDMMVQQKGKQGIQNPLPASHIIFTKHIFQTSRNFDNVFFDQKEKVKNHTEFFLERKDWYDAKGIPHTLGFMFHGSPGCGKTSTIKAIANVGRRHIINIHLSEIKSKEQLTHLFFNDDIHIWDNGKTETYKIPVNERIYVIEDIDAMGEVVLKREWKKPEVKKEIKFDEFGNIIQEEQNPIDLSFLLNLLDGTLESSGRILALSTNFPERIDRALIRPGRIDMIIHFKKCSIKVLREMVESFYDQQIEESEFDDITLNEKWSPAEVNQILFRNFNDRLNALTELKNLTSEDLYGFELSA